MTDKMQTPRTGGGAATSAGILFQQQIGALMLTPMLAGRRLDARLELGEARPVWVRFETEAPVDDVLVATSADGFVAIQAKTTASLSRDPDSPFGKTIAQFVRHWLATHQGDGTHQWDRPLDDARDRLVLAVGPQSPANIRVHLPAALQLAVQSGGGHLNQAQTAAFDDYAASVEAAWTRATTEAFDPGFPAKLAKFIRILSFDPENADRQIAATHLEPVLVDPDQARTALGALETICARLMSERGGVDQNRLRELLASEGPRLDTPPEHRNDIRRLQAHSEAVAAALNAYETIEATVGQPVSVERDCQPLLLEAVETGSLLIVGEPGAGKSGVLNALARDLRSQGRDVIELAVDRYSVESLEGLQHELGLQRPLLEVLTAWDGDGEGWLIIDALDATRGGRGEGVFRTLIEQVLERNGRWKVVASIRSFDLRMGQQFRSLFRGAPPINALMDPEFGQVRHVQVPAWSEAEFTRLLVAAPPLADALRNAPAPLRDLAAVPFNTRLLSELIRSGLVTSDLSHIVSQAQLLQLYWDHRLTPLGAPGRACIRRIVDAMVETRRLRASIDAASGTDPGMIDTLEGQGVVLKVDNERWVQFRHHLLFDFAAARVLMDPDALISGGLRFPKAEGKGLMLAPALGFLLREIWDADPTRADFWQAGAFLMADTEGDPVIRGATGRLCAEYPTNADDAAILAQRVVAGDANSAAAFIHTSGALAVRLEDRPDTPLAPWARLAAGVAANVAPVAGSLRFLLFKLVTVTSEPDLRTELGVAARALFEHFWASGSTGMAIDLVAQTFETDVGASQTLLAQLFTRERLVLHGAEEAPAVAHRIALIAPAAPDFARDVYAAVFGFSVEDARETSMGNSQILPLRSNARQDYDMARYSLSEYLPTFLAEHPYQAVDAVIAATEGFVEREHRLREEHHDASFEVNGRKVRLREDLSYIWAHDPDTVYGHDADALVRCLMNGLKGAKEDAALKMAQRLVERADLAVLWSRLFMAAAARRDRVADLALPYAMAEPMLTSASTRKDAIDVIAVAYPHLPAAERETFEAGVLTFDFSSFKYPEAARQGFLDRLFGAIGKPALASEAARALVDAAEDGQDGRNERLYRIHTSTGSPDPYHWIDDLDRESKVDQALMMAIDVAKAALGLDRAGDDTGDALDGATALTAVETLAVAMDSAVQNARLFAHAEGIVGEGVGKIIDRKLVPPLEDAADTARLLTLLRMAVSSSGPLKHEETEANFEQGASWGSPAARVEAAEAVLDLVLQRPDLYADLGTTIDALLEDPHPAVRLQAGLHLLRIWDIDRDGFWMRLERRASEEANLGVLDHLIDGALGRVMHADPVRSEALAMTLLARFEDEPERQARVRKHLASVITVLWVTHQGADAERVLDRWAADLTTFAPELAKITATLRNAFVSGLSGDRRPDDAGLRQRSLALAERIVEAAATGLTRHYDLLAPTEAESEAASTYARLLDSVCRELYFASGAFRSSGRDDPVPDAEGLAIFLAETRNLLKRIGDSGTPHTVYYLLQLLEHLAPVEPAVVFDLMANALMGGGRRTGYQFEFMGADLLVRMVGVYLADHKALFEDEARRAVLIECLEIFMEAGWPAARRLLYRLPELIQ